MKQRSMAKWQLAVLFVLVGIFAATSLVGAHTVKVSDMAVTMLLKHLYPEASKFSYQTVKVSHELTEELAKKNVTLEHEEKAYYAWKGDARKAIILLFVYGHNTLFSALDKETLAAVMTDLKGKILEVGLTNADGHEGDIHDEFLEQFEGLTVSDDFTIDAKGGKLKALGKDPKAAQGFADNVYARLRILAEVQSPKM